jgi:hypothetical protein
MKRIVQFTGLLACSYQVAGAELSELVIKELFNDLGVEPNISLPQRFSCLERSRVTREIGAAVVMMRVLLWDFQC